MALIEEQQADKEQEVYFNFINSLKSPITKETYYIHIKKYLKFSNLNKLSELLTIQEPQKQIIKYIMSLKERGLNTRSISTMLYGVYHFYVMNDVILNRKKINKFIGEATLKTEDRPYTNEEIQKILNISDLRMKVVIGLMASAGLRIGALAKLRLSNLKKVEQCYKVTVYECTNEQYYSFCTPECSQFINDYLEYRSKNGEKLTENSYLIRDQFDVTDIDQIRNKSRGIQTGTLKHMLNLLLVKAGVREVNHTSPHKRKEVAMAHGFRKFFTNELRKAHVPIEVRWLLEGHKLKGNDDSYVRAEVEERYAEYQKAIDNLTIDPANRLLKQVNILQVEVSRLDKLEESIKKLQQKYKKG
jgi:site-specific recombinase XerD